MKLKSLFLALLAMAAIVGCQQEIEITPVLTLDKETVSVPAEGGTFDVNVTSNVDWTATMATEGFSASPASGKASDKAVKVTVTVAENTAEEARTATMTVKADDYQLSKTVTFNQAAKAVEPEPEFAAGDYWIMAEKDDAVRVMQPIPSDKTYGYPASEDAIDGKSYTTNVFTITAVEGGYTIQDASERYYYQEAGTTHKTFSVSAEVPENGGVWTIVEGEDGTATITSVASSKVVGYGEGTYTSFGVYGEGEGEGSVLPKLVKAEDPIEVSNEIVDVTIPEFIASEVSSAVKYRVTGTITEIVINTQYKNAEVTIADAEGNTLLLYRMTAAEGGTALEDLGLNAGDVLTAVGERGEYNGAAQLVNGYYESHVDGEEPEAETVIWEGTHNVAGWSGNQDLAWGGYDWSKVTAGTLLKLYVTPNNPSSDWWCISLRTAAEGWPNITGIPAQYDKPTYSITLELTQAIIDELVAGNGLIMTGSETTITKVSLLPADAEVVLWEGEMTSTSYSNCQIGQVNDWLNNGVASGDKVKIYVTAGDTWAMMISDGQWNKWFATGEGGVQEGLYGQGFSNYNTDLTNGYIEFEMTEAMSTTLTGYTWGNLLIIQGDGITVTKISFK